MANLEDIICQKLTLKTFLLVGFFLIALPVLFNFDYLLFGEKVNGMATDLYLIKEKKSSYTVSRIDYQVEGKPYVFLSPKNELYEKGDIVELYYIKNNPKKAILASPLYFYRRHSMVNVICTIFMIFWMAVFFTYGIRY